MCMENDDLKPAYTFFILNLFKSEVVTLSSIFLQCITDQWCIIINSASLVGWILDLTPCRLKPYVLKCQCWRHILFRSGAEVKLSSPDLKAWPSVCLLSSHSGRAVRAPSEVTRRRWRRWASPRRSVSGGWRSCCSKRRSSSSREVSVRERQGVFFGNLVWQVRAQGSVGLCRFLLAPVGSTELRPLRCFFF